MTDEPRTTIRHADFRQDCRLVLRRFLPRHDEAARETAYELGRRAVTGGMSLLEVCRVHHEVSIELLKETRPEDHLEVLEAAGELLLEVVAAYDMTNRSVLDP
jgi:hypothetical protein